MSIKENIQTIDTLIQAQVVQVNALIQLLDIENTALVSRDAEQLQSLNSQKTDITEQLEQLTQQQNIVLKKLGFDPSKQGLQSLVNKLSGPTQQKIGEHHKILTDALVQCQEKNKINGQIIAANRQSVEIALSVLHGKDHNAKLTYGPSGETHNSDQGNSLAKA